MIRESSSTSAYSSANCDALIQFMEEVSIRIAIDLESLKILLNATETGRLDQKTGS